ncbi:MAG: hypothetical protein V4717_01470 [Bacteroidota bacterium]
MKAKSILFFLFLHTCCFLKAQTWDGSTSTEWNTPANWNTNAVPTVTGAVTIPNTVNKPVLPANITIASLNMSAGSALNFNGFSLSVTGLISFSGATLNNTNAATDIAITVNSAGGGGSNYLGGNIFNDHTTINFNGTGTSYEGYLSGNTYNNNTTININGTGRLYTSYNQKSTFNGNLVVNRTVAGITDLFNNGFNGITGNFSYMNNAGGDNQINNSNILSGAITGTINITTGGAGNPQFLMRRIKNLTSGGVISVQNSGYSVIENDTLNLASLTVNGFSGSNGDEMTKNVITGNVVFSEAATNTGAVFVGGNIINGNTHLGTNAAIVWYEGYLGSDTYNGNTSFNLNGTGRFYSSYNQKSTFNGNLIVNRTGVGITDLFNAGFNGIAGNFSYTNNAGGDNLINNSNIFSGAITGTVNITTSGTGNPQFLMRRIKNLTTGGTISVQNSGYVVVENDTLTLASLTVNGFTGAIGDEMSKNVITGDVVFSEAATNTGAVYVGGNIINGNTTLGTNAAVTWYEGYLASDTYNGNTSFNLNGTGRFYSSYNQKSGFNGNLTVIRTAAGITDLFNAGFSSLTGNFSYTNNAGGDNLINNSNTLSGAINGTVNITASGAGNPQFLLRRIKNLTTGGTISVQNSGYTVFENDTLTLASLTVNGFTGSNGDELSKNVITGNVVFADAATNTGSVYIGQNKINGNTTLTSNASLLWYEGYLGSDYFEGNVTFNRMTPASTFYIAYNDTVYINQNFVFNSTNGFDINSAIQFTGDNNAIIEQLGTQPIIIPRLIIKKTGNGHLTLNDSVTVTSTANFTSGIIYSSTGKELIFPNGVGYNGASATSHVVGPVTKIGSDAFVFPVGSPTTLNTVAMSAPVGAASRFKAAYRYQNPSSDGYNTSLKAGSFGAASISKAGFWELERQTGVTNVNLTFGFGTNPYEDYSSLANLKVAFWSGAQWDDKGNGGTTGTAASGTITHSGGLTTYGIFTLAGVTPTYFYVYGTPGPGPDGTPVKLGGKGGWPPYSTKQLPDGNYSPDSIFLVPNGTSASFKLRDTYGVEKDDTTITVAAAPVNYISANGNGAINFTGWRHFVYMKTAGDQIIGAIRDNNLTLGNTVMSAYFSSSNVATAPNGNLYLKRSFKITSEFAPAGTRRVRFYILKTEFSNLQAADPTSFPNGINSITITKYTGPQEDSLFNPIPGGNSEIIPASDITIVDLGTMYSLDINVSGFSGFYIGGINTNLNLCPGSTISAPSNITGSSYQWQVSTGGAYSNLSNTGIYSGVTTKTLKLTNAPSTLYGNTYRCLVNGVSYSQVYMLKFNVLWQGNVSTRWENTANWSCGVLPDANTDVMVNPGKLNYPQVGSNSSIRSLKAAPGTSVTIKTGFNLTITK